MHKYNSEIEETPERQNILQVKEAADFDELLESQLMKRIYIKCISQQVENTDRKRVTDKVTLSHQKQTQSYDNKIHQVQTESSQSVVLKSETKPLKQVERN